MNVAILSPSTLIHGEFVHFPTYFVSNLKCIVALYFIYTDTTYIHLSYYSLIAEIAYIILPQRIHRNAYVTTYDAHQEEMKDTSCILYDHSN